MLPILIVDDEADVLALAGRIVERAGYRALLAHDGRTALARFEAEEGRIAALLTDVVMPGMTGDVLAAELRRRAPSLPVLIMSGFAGSVTAQQIAALDAVLLPKPFLPTELIAQLHQRVGRPTPG